MSKRTITSPGVEINEIDLSQITRSSGETNVFITGFASRGPTQEVINITSLTEFEEIYGTPTNAAERYLYHSAKQILTTSPANLLVNRLPYGAELGDGFSNKYSALVFPVKHNNTSYETATEYTICEPTSILLSDEEYNSLVTNEVAWTSAYRAGINSINFGTIGYGGIVVLNSAKTTVNNLFDGYYVGFADNSNINPATNFDSITGVKAIASINNNNQLFLTVPSTRLNFELSQTYSTYSSNSISQIIENYPTGYDFSTTSFNDYVTMMVFKLRPSIYSQDTIKLDYVISEGYTGSLYSLRTLNNPNGGLPSTSFIDNLVNNRSNNVVVLTNPHISNLGDWVNTDGTPKKKVRIEDGAKNLYAIGVYVSDTDTSAKVVGNIPGKLERILSCIENDDTIDLDVVAEAGLGTIWTNAKARSLDPMYTNKPMVYDDLYKLDITSLKNTSGTLTTGIREYYAAVAGQFDVFATKTRKDHVFIADPLRNIFIQGSNTKISKNKNFIFSTEIYWPLKNLYASIESSYVATYGNWFKVNDSASDNFCWVPPSGFIASVFASSAQVAYPWSAPAGFSRGTISGVIDIAITPTQKQRDLLYKINVNPIAFFPNDGIVVFGQKTLYRKPSAFDRLNVRRLFLTLEKTTEQVLKLFIFEPNTFTTRSRLVGSLTPIFDEARLHDGLYDYTIVCDERNNTPMSIDNNEIRVSLYVQPVRTAEFILADFIATRTGVNFEELIS